MKTETEKKHDDAPNGGAVRDCPPSPGSEPKLYEITALVHYSVVIRANSKEAALKHVETWEHAWDANAELIGATDVDLLDVRDGTAEDAHQDISQNNKTRRKNRNHGRNSTHRE